MSIQLKAATRLSASWWDDLGPEGQAQYLKDHPNSEKAKEAREQQKGKKPDAESKDSKKKPEPEKKEKTKEAQEPGASEKKETEPKKEKPEPKEKPEEKKEPESKEPEAKKPETPAEKEPSAPPGIDEKPKQKPLAPGRPLADFAKERDDPSFTAETLFSKLKPEDAEEIKQKTKEAMGLKPSDQEYIKDGYYTPERKLLHQKIIRSILTPEKIAAATPKPGENPTFIVLGGRGGSGKSSFTKNEHTGAPATVNEFDSSKFLTLDADAVKEMLQPPYEGWNANQVHEESSYLFDEIMTMSRRMGLNIISDATLKSDKLGSQLEEMAARGYDIEGHYMYLPRQKAAERACGRYLKDGPQDRGRLVPPEVILQNTNNEANFDKLKKYFKRWSAYNNDVERGQPPQLIDHSDLQQKKKTDARVIKSSYNGSEPKTHQLLFGGLRKLLLAENEGVNMTTPEQEEKPLYTSDDWENDPFLTSNPERTEMVERDSWPTMMALGIKTSQIKDPKAKAEYTAFLKAQGQKKE
jgi:predicted ABC-type ATPase